jgi:hypothetical protein
MELFLATFLVVALAALGMAVGVIAGRRPIGAGCGRVDASGDVQAGCEICGAEQSACRGMQASGPS